MNNWLDKYEQGGMVLKQKTQDNYGKKANPNNPDVSLPPGFKGLAYNTKGRNYSPAWGGQFQSGGRLPIITNDPKDPKLKKYQDSLSLYNLYEKVYRDAKKSDKVTSEYPYEDFQISPVVGKVGDVDAYRSNVKANAYKKKEIKPITEYSYLADSQDRYIDGQFYPGKKDATFFSHRFKKPVQPVEYKKLEEIKPIQPTPRGSKKYIVNDIEVSEEDFLSSGATTGGGKRVMYNTPKQGERKVLRLDGTPETDPEKIRRALATADKETKMAMGGSLPGAVGFTYARTVGAAPSNGPYAKKTKASAQNGKEMKFYQEGLDFKPKTISQDGSEIPVDPMGYWNPENIGNPVIIPSTDITMEGVDQPLIGISDTGDVQYMYPGEDYEFDGEYVTEYPVAKKGISVNNADAQPIEKLDQSLNFTNYNKPTKGGWLDKYN